MLMEVIFFGHIKENNKVKPLTSRIKGFQKVESPTYNHFLSKDVYSMQPILQPLYKLLQNENKVKWTKEHQQIFD